MELTELIAENIVSKLSALLKKKISVGNLRGDVLASSDLSETGKNYDQLRQAAESGNELEIKETPGTNTLSSGLIVPINHSGHVIGVAHIQDKPEEYSHYRHILTTTIELLVQQNMVTDSFPYKDKIKDNFVFGLLHRRVSVADVKISEEAELFNINLTRDKIVTIIKVRGFWDGIFGGNLTASEDEKQTALSTYKKKLFDAFSHFFGRLSGCSISYFGDDTFVALVDELYSLDGQEMIDLIRQKNQEFHDLIKKQFNDKNEVQIGVGSFYRGREGAILAYEEARRALNLAISIGQTSNVCHIDDLGMIATLAGGNKKWQDNFVKRMLSKLLAEDYLLETVEVFFDQNMSLTQTSAELKVHRNTLLYRLDKVKKITGLDPRKFNDAMELKVALILHKVLSLEKSSTRQL